MHPRQRHDPWLSNAPLPAAKSRQPRLHFLPRLRPLLPARQRRPPRRAAGEHALGRFVPLRHRSFQPAVRRRRAGRAAHLRRVRQCRRHDRAGRRMARPPPPRTRRSSRSRGRRPGLPRRRPLRC